jgi:hypothetical protein
MKLLQRSKYGLSGIAVIKRIRRSVLRAEHAKHSYWILLTALLVLAACSTRGESDLPVQAAKTPQNAIATEVPKATSVPPTPSPRPPTETPSPTPLPALWVAEYVPDAIVKQVMVELGDRFQITANKSTATLRLDIGGNVPVAEWVYALVAPFPTIPDSVTYDDVQTA